MMITWGEQCRLTFCQTVLSLFMAFPRVVLILQFRLKDYVNLILKGNSTNFTL